MRNFVEELLSAAVAPVAERQFGEPHALKPVLAQLHRDFGDDPGELPPPHQIDASVRALRTGTPTRKQVLECCLAAAIPVDDVRIIESSSDAVALLNLIGRQEDAEGIDRYSRRAFRGLARAYFDWAPEDRSRNAGWTAIREWLESIASRTDLPDDDYWAAVRWHKAAFGVDGPYAYREYGLASAHLVELRRTFGVPESSWFLEEIFRARVTAACTQPDATFRQNIDGIVLELQGFPSLREWALAALLERYHASSFATQPHERLLDLALECWKTPRDTANFAAWGAVGDDVREMVARWLVGQIVVKVFEAFGQTGLGTEAAQRAAFWRQWANAITEVHVFIDSREQGEFSRVKELVGDAHWARIESGESSHAFLMQIGAYSFVEFSRIGNAMYPYETTDLPFDLKRRSYGIKTLKKREKTLRVPGEGPSGALLETWTHQGNWQRNFDYRMRMYLGISR